MRIKKSVSRLDPNIMIYKSKPKKGNKKKIIYAIKICTLLSLNLTFKTHEPTVYLFFEILKKVKKIYMYFKNISFCVLFRYAPSLSNK